MWNGLCPTVSMARRELQAVLMSDASGSWGCGAYPSTGWGRVGEGGGGWGRVGGVVPLELLGSWREVYITVKELFTIVLSVAVWGPLWKGLTICCRWDNAAVVAIVNSGRSKVDRAMHQMQCLSFFLAHWKVTLVFCHFLGVANSAADALSRILLSSFQRLVPLVDKEPTSIPECMLQCLVSRPQIGLK